MNRWILIGIILIALGALGLVIPRITYEEQAAEVDVGPLDIQVQEERSIPIPDLLAGGVLLVGVVFVAMGAAKSPR